MTLEELVKISYEQAKKSGWGDPPIVEQIALIHSEASEALEAFRNHEPLSWIRPADDDEGKPGKPEGVASEYADILIRIGHYCGALGIDLEAEVLKKLSYNSTRPFRHGGKAC